MNIVIPVFDRITVLDAVGPYEVLSRLPGASVCLAGLSRGEIRSDNRALGLTVYRAIDEIAGCDLLVVPGGYGERALERDQRFLGWLRAMDATTRITASVCTGALLLAAAGLLDGRPATTHWAFFDRLAALGAVPTAQRIVRAGKYATAAGVSAGIDLALAIALELTDRETAARIQLAIEYDPDPPLDAGNASTAPPERRQALLARIREREAQGLSNDLRR